MEINTTIKYAATAWKEINPSILQTSLRGRTSEEVRQRVATQSDTILSRFTDSQGIIEYVKGLDLGISEEKLKSSLEKGIGMIVKICIKLKVKSSIQGKLTNGYAFHFIQSLKKSKQRGVKSESTRLFLAEKSHVLPGYIIDILAGKLISEVDGIEVGKKFSDFFSNSNITTICVRDNNPEEKLKEILRNVQTISNKLISEVDGIEVGKKFSDFFSNYNITSVCVGYNNPEEKLKEILRKAEEYILIKKGKPLKNDDIIFCMEIIKDPEF